MSYLQPVSFFDKPATADEMWFKCDTIDLQCFSVKKGNSIFMFLLPEIKESFFKKCWEKKMAQQEIFLVSFLIALVLYKVQHVSMFLCFKLYNIRHNAG